MMSSRVNRFGSGHSIRSPPPSGRPLWWTRRSPTVIRAVTAGSCMAKSGRYFTTGSSQASLPCCTSRASTAAVIALELEAILNSVRVVTGSPEPATVSPKPRANVISPSSITPTAMPARW